MRQITFDMEARPPYDFALTAGYVTHFEQRYAAESFEEGVYRRLLDLDPFDRLRAGSRLALAETRSAGGPDAPRVEVTLRGEGLDAAAVDPARAQLALLLGTEDDVRPFYAMARGDDALAPLVDALYGLHVPQAASVYEALTLSIVGQQISAQVARVLRGLIIETFGRRAEFDGESFYAFPRADEVAAASVEDLRGLKLSQRKAEYVLGVAKLVASGELDLEGLRGLPADGGGGAADGDTRRGAVDGALAADKRAGGAGRVSVGGPGAAEDDGGAGRRRRADGGGGGAGVLGAVVAAPELRDDVPVRVDAGRAEIIHEGREGARSGGRVVRKGLADGALTPVSSTGQALTLSHAGERGLRGRG